VAGAVRIGNTVGAAITNRRVLEPVEARIALTAGALLLGIAALVIEWPRQFAYGVAAIAVWLALALLARGVALLRARRRAENDSGSSSARRSDM
jgi:cardiolipin synthase